jgi:hypothetical protein
MCTLWCQFLWIVPFHYTFGILFGTQLFRNGQPSHGGDRKIFEVMTSKWVEPCLLQILGNQTEKSKSSK